VTFGIESSFADDIDLAAAPDLFRHSGGEEITSENDHDALFSFHWIGIKKNPARGVQHVILVSFQDNAYAMFELDF
jgi:hypothetical protein